MRSGRRHNHLAGHLSGPFFGGRRPRNWVIATRRPRVTAQQATNRKSGALQRPVDAHRLEGVRRTGGVVLADRTVQRRNQGSIGLQQPDQGVLHDASRSRQVPRAESKSPTRSPLRDGGSARTTKSTGNGNPGSAAAARCRNRRLTRLRSTALPTALETMKPALAGGSVVLRTCITKQLRPQRTPCRRVTRNSPARRNRDSVGSTCRTQPARRTRPRRRREEMMARPALVRIRRRKPWVRLRRRLLGWKVRLLTRMLHCSMVGTDAPNSDARTPRRRLLNDTRSDPVQQTRVPDGACRADTPKWGKIFCEIVCERLSTSVGFWSATGGTSAVFPPIRTQSVDNRVETRGLAA